MDNKFQGKRAELGVYDDWMHGDDCVECVVPQKSNNYCFPATNIVCGYIEGDHEIKIDTTLSQDSLQRIIDNLIKQLEKVND